MQEKKVVLITGGSSGIGKACAEYLASKDCIVYGTSRQIGKEKQIDGYTLIPMDIRDKTSVNNGVNFILNKNNRIDILINNAGLMLGGPIECASESEITDLFKTNVYGLHNVTKSVLPSMRKAESGKIINISSIGGLMGLPFQGIYSATKFAVKGYSESLGLELKPFGIDVICIEPGDTKTNVIQNRKFPDECLSRHPYEIQMARTMKIIENEESNGISPVIIAHKIEKLIRKSKTKPHYLVAHPEQIISYHIKNFLGTSLFEKIIAYYYKIRK